MKKCPNCSRKFKDHRGLSAHQRSKKCAMYAPITNKMELENSYVPLTRDTLDEMKRRRDRLNTAIEIMEGMFV